MHFQRTAIQMEIQRDPEYVTAMPPQDLCGGLPAPAWFTQVYRGCLPWFCYRGRLSNSTMQFSYFLFTASAFTGSKWYCSLCEEFCLSVWCPVSRELCVPCSCLGSVMESIPLCVCSSDRTAHSTVGVRHNLTGTRHLPSRPALCWKQAVFVVTGEGVKLRTSFCSLNVSALLEVLSQLVQPVPFYVFLFPCIGCTIERKNWRRASLSRNSGKGNGIVNWNGLHWWHSSLGRQCVPQHCCPSRSGLLQLLQDWGVPQQLAL